LDENVENFAFLVDGPSHEHPLAVVADDHFIQMPDGICASALAVDVGRDSGVELVRPAPDRFLAAIDSPFGNQILDVAQAQREAVIKPNSEPDDVWREAAV